MQVSSEVSLGFRMKRKENLRVSCGKPLEENPLGNLHETRRKTSRLMQGFLWETQRKPIIVVLLRVSRSFLNGFPRGFLKHALWFSFAFPAGNL